MIPIYLGKKSEFRTDDELHPLNPGRTEAPIKILKKGISNQTLRLIFHVPETVSQYGQFNAL